MMTARLHLQDTPGLLSQYLRALLAKERKNYSLPSLQIWQTGVIANPKKVKQYAKLCGFQHSTTLPLTYPHLLAFPLQMELMLRPDFPLALMGLVHIRNRIIQHRAIAANTKLDICCYFANGCMTDKGFEFDICTKISSHGELLWESTSTNLKRIQSGTPKPTKPRPESQIYSQQETWSLPSNLGRLYAKVSGDSNPIHLFKLSAKLFGFKGHIAHGMWTKARAAATLYPLLNNDKVDLSVEFKQPLLLPCQACLNWNELAAQGTNFEIKNIKGDRCHVLGRIQLLD